MSSKSPTAGIILAAGASVRFGQPKQLVELREKYLLEWVLDAALDSRLDAVVLVLGHQYHAIQQALGGKAARPGLQVVINRDYRKGQSTSLKTGLTYVRRNFSSVMYLLADQPMITSKTINLLLDRFDASDKSICVPARQGRRGNPTLFRRPVYDEIMMIDGDTGARNLTEKYRECVLFVEVDDPLCFVDIDSPGDLEALSERLPD